MHALPDPFIILPEYLLRFSLFPPPRPSPRLSPVSRSRSVHGYVHGHVYGHVYGMLPITDYRLPAFTAYTKSDSCKLAPD